MTPPRIVLASLVAASLLVAPRALADDSPSAATSEPVPETAPETASVLETETALVPEPEAAPASEPEAAPASEPEAAPESEAEAAPASPLDPALASTLEQELALPAPPRVIDDLRLGRGDDGLGNAVWVMGGAFGADVRNDSVVLGTFDAGLRLAVAPDARATLDWGVAVAQTRVRGAYTSPTTVDEFDTRLGRVEARNADLSFEWLPLLTQDVRFGFGAGVAIPVAATTRLPSSAETQSLLDASTLVHEAYLAMNGGQRAWRYRPERVGVYVPLTLAVSLAPETVLRVEGTAAVSFRVLGGMGAEVLGDLLLAADLGTAIVPELRLGVRASVAGLDLGTTTAAAQPAVEGWARLEFAPVSILFRGTVGLGGPYGVGSSFAGWGLHAGASVAL